MQRSPFGDNGESILRIKDSQLGTSDEEDCEPHSTTDRVMSASMNIQYYLHYKKEEVSSKEF